MLYISSIGNSGFVTAKAVAPQRLSDYLMNKAFVKEINTGYQSQYSGQEVLGVGEDFAVVHTRKTALFHYYVVDYCVRQPVELTLGETYTGRIVRAIEHGNKDVLELQFFDHNIKVQGFSGSVAMWEDSVLSVYAHNCRRVICTLYDFFVYMCRITGKNLMEFRYIQFFIVNRMCCIEFELAQTPEAKRFYTKMMFDVAGDYELKAPTFNKYDIYR